MPLRREIPCWVRVSQVWHSRARGGSTKVGASMNYSNQPTSGHFRTFYGHSGLLLQIPLRGAMTTGIGGSEQHRDRRATRPDVYRVMGPARLSADSDQKKASEGLAKTAISTTDLQSKNQFHFPKSSRCLEDNSASTATANQLSAEKTPLINKAAINEARESPAQ